MRNTIWSVSILWLAASAFGQAKPRPIPTGPASVLEAKANTLFNGWKLSPAGRHVGEDELHRVR